MHFHTDDAQSILSSLAKLTKGQAENLITQVKSTIQSSIYPHERSVWMFNDPAVEVEMLKLALIGKEQSALMELQSMIEIHKDTYPFIEVICEPLISEEDITSHINVESFGNLEEDKPSVSLDDKRASSLGAFFIPTATLGSLYILSKIAKESEL